jgi:Tannase and feruloyl esterase
LIARFIVIRYSIIDVSTQNEEEIMTIKSFNTIGLSSIALLLAACGGSNSPPPAAVVTPAPAPAPMSCTQLKSLVIPASAIGLPTNGAVIDSTEVVPASGVGVASIGQYCKVIGSISPIDTTAPKIRFQVNLPANWNKKTMMFGGGGYNGELGIFINNVHASPTDQLSPQGRGYAVFGSDAGHTQNSTFIFGRDGSFAVNDEALKNFTGDALKKTKDASTFVVNAHYLQTIQKSYFFGGSTGGREAMEVTQQFPQDFDGVIAMFPLWNSGAGTLQMGRVTRALAQPGAFPNVAKRILVLNAATAACDTLDGVADGIISNVPACNASFNPSTATTNGLPGGPALRCVGGADTGDTCLSDAQITALNVMNTPATFNFALASGETGHPGFTTWGTDLGIPSTKPELFLNQIIGYNENQPANPMNPSMPYMSVFYDQWAKYFVTRDANFNSLTLDPENPGTHAARISTLSALQDINKTDLSVFMNRGGKLLIAHGIHDGLVSSRSSAQYYERVKARMGASNVASFYRYYEIPGYGHSISNVFNLGWDSVTALENWAERGVAPVNLIATDKTGVPGRTRPLCEYPTWPRYNGSGDHNLANNFTCVNQ